jgi:AcrR family transcriptional regulator
VQPELLSAALGEELAEYPDDVTTDRILDAALAEFGSFGLRRATVEDITKRAKVGRMTLHRRFPSKQALIAAVFLREIRRVLAEIDDVMTPHDGIVDRLANGLAFGIRAVHEHPLFSRLLETDSEAMLPYLTLRAGSLMIAASSYVATQLDAADDHAGSIRENARTGEAILRICHSILLTPDGNFPLRDHAAMRDFLHGPITALTGH